MIFDTYVYIIYIYIHTLYICILYIEYIQYIVTNEELIPYWQDLQKSREEAEQKRITMEEAKRVGAC